MDGKPCVVYEALASSSRRMRRRPPPCPDAGYLASTRCSRCTRPKAVRDVFDMLQRSCSPPARAAAAAHRWRWWTWAVSTAGAPASQMEGAEVLAVASRCRRCRRRRAGSRAADPGPPGGRRRDRSARARDHARPAADRRARGAHEGRISEGGRGTARGAAEGRGADPQARSRARHAAQRVHGAAGPHARAHARLDRDRRDREHLGEARGARAREGDGGQQRHDRRGHERLHRRAVSRCVTGDGGSGRGPERDRGRAGGILRRAPGGGPRGGRHGYAGTDAEPAQAAKLRYNTARSALGLETLP